jgi:endonuclease-3 related protein
MQGDRLPEIYNKLLDHYGALHWWPARTPYEVLVGAILTQNTAWSNVEKAIANFGCNLSPEFVMNLSQAKLTEIIRPAGFFNQKAVYLREVTQWFRQYDYDISSVQRLPIDRVRTELLSVKGVGRETADSILLYAFSFPTFVVDAYTMRLLSRLPIEAGGDYETVKDFFERRLTRDVGMYNNYHALIVINAKEHCRKKPICPGCPLVYMCRFGKQNSENFNGPRN